ncbi:uncharacterized protein LOC114177567 isoform X2 [Vigna unguiculata]|uniref:uncharacterized protein LOC114177567 isoform X2 n=1 Tax=Vigna unguiculata TaxID=3917 RepID=UPI00101673EF|nr:uncharacterized protein LOC114177567 isoform X2 [Vigna unguiculata]
MRKFYPTRRNVFKREETISYRFQELWGIFIILSGTPYLLGEVVIGRNQKRLPSWTKKNWILIRVLWLQLKERMHAASQTFILNLTPQVTRCKQRVDRYIVPILNYGYFGLSWKLEVGARSILKRQDIKCLPAAGVLSDAEISSNQFEDFSVSVAETDDTRELKISVEVSGNKTQRIFDDVFKRMVAAAQPIPGFRRVKGGKTPDIPKNILLEVLGPSKVFKEVIKKIINSTVAEYVEKERLTVSTDLRVEQSFEDLESTFVEGEKFSFDVLLKLKN